MNGHACTCCLFRKKRPCVQQRNILRFNLGTSMLLWTRRIGIGGVLIAETHSLLGNSFYNSWLPPNQMSSAPNFVGLEPVLGVTIGFLALYYIFLYGQAITKFYLFFQARRKDPKISFGKIKYSSTETTARVADRTAGNMMEQAIPFLVSLWLCAIFESPTYASRLGWLWLLFRSFYPFVFAGIWLPASTVPGYVFISLLIQPVALKATYGFFWIPHTSFRLYMKSDVVAQRQLV